MTLKYLCFIALLVALLVPSYSFASYDSYKEKRMIQDAAESLQRRLDEEERRNEQRYNEEQRAKHRGSGGGGAFICSVAVGVFFLAFLVSWKNESAKDKVIGDAKDSGFNADAFEKKCEKCAESIKVEVKLCKFCGKKYNSVEVKKAVYQAAEAYLERYGDDLERSKKEIVSRGMAVDTLDAIDVLMKKAMKLYKSEEFQDALALYDKAIEISPENKGAYYRRAFVQSKVGNRKKAVADMRQAAKLGHKKAIERLAKRR